MEADPAPKRSAARRVLIGLGALGALIAVVIAALAVFPLGSVDLGPRPDPAPDYAAAKARFDAITAEIGRAHV